MQLQALSLVDPAKEGHSRSQNGRQSNILSRTDQHKQGTFTIKPSKNFDQLQAQQSFSDPNQVKRLNKQNPFNPLITNLEADKTAKAQDALTPDPRHVVKGSSPITKILGHSGNKSKGQPQQNMNQFQFVIQNTQGSSAFRNQS